MTADEYRVLLDRLEALEAGLDSAHRDGSGAWRAFVGRVASGGAFPTAAGSFLLVNPVLVTGAEVEGGAIQRTVDTSTALPVALVGTKLPTVGDDLIVRSASWRWVAQAGGYRADRVSILNCRCPSIPILLHMTSSDHVGNDGLFQDATLRWTDPTPQEYAPLGLGAACFLSDESFKDVDGDSFRYYFKCGDIYFDLIRVYVTCMFGSPFRDSVRYYWEITLSGNSCDPFALTNGIVYTGGDSSISVDVVDAT